MINNPLNVLIQPREESTTTFRWAVVVGESPLQIRIETETAPLPGKPSTLVAGLQEDDRVFIVVHSGRATVLGKAGG